MKKVWLVLIVAVCFCFAIAADASQAGGAHQTAAVTQADFAHKAADMKFTGVAKVKPAAAKKISGLPTPASPSVEPLAVPVSRALMPNAAVALWDQPLSTINTLAYVDQAFPDLTGYDSFLTDDFTNAATWNINALFVPGDGWNSFSTLANATALNWAIYADDGGIPDGDPSGGGNAPFWSLSVPPTDPQVTLTTGTPGGFLSNARIDLKTRITLPAGTWWLVFYPTMNFSGGGQFGRQLADTTNGAEAKIINHGGSFGWGTTWVSAESVLSGFTQQDLAFTLETIQGGGSTAFAIDVTANQLVTFDAENPTGWTVIGATANKGFYAGDFLNGDTSKLYAISYFEKNLYTINTATAAETLVGACTTFGTESWTGMTASVDGTLYASSTDISRSTLYTIDPATGTATVIGQITNAPGIIDIAINTSGQIYGVDIINDNLVSIDPATGAGTIVGAIGFDASFAQGMSFDWKTGILYLAALNNSSLYGQMRIADTATGATTPVGFFPGAVEVDCLAFVNCRDNDGDGYGQYCAAGPDCDDNNSAIHPGATEVCNGIDDNCNGQTDEGVKTTFYRDADSDTFGDAAVTMQACTEPAGYLSDNSDCNDADAFYTDICPECTVKIIPQTLGWLIGDKEKTRSLLVIGKRGTEFGDNSTIKWESDAIEVVSNRVLFKRFMFMRAKFNGEPLDKQEYRVLVGECEGKIKWAR
jgi:hypothetical protein